MNSLLKKSAAAAAAVLLLGGVAAPLAHAATPTITVSVNGKVWQEDESTINIWANHDEVSLAGTECRDAAHPGIDFNLWVWYRGVSGEAVDGKFTLTPGSGNNLVIWDAGQWVGPNSDAYLGNALVQIGMSAAPAYVLPKGDGGVKSDGSWKLALGKLPRGEQVVSIACVGYDGTVKYSASFNIIAVTPTIATDANWNIDLSLPFTVWGAGYFPGEDVSLTVASDPTVIVTVKADADGYVQAVVTLPAAYRTGTHQLSWVGQTSGRTASLTFVAGQSPTPTPTPTPAPTATPGPGQPGFTTDL